MVTPFTRVLWGWRQDSWATTPTHFCFGFSVSFYWDRVSLSCPWTPLIAEAGLQACPVKPGWVLTFHWGTHTVNVPLTATPRGISHYRQVSLRVPLFCALRGLGGGHLTNDLGHDSNGHGGESHWPCRSHFPESNTKYLFTCVLAILLLSCVFCQSLCPFLKVVFVPFHY